MSLIEKLGIFLIFGRIMSDREFGYDTEHNWKINSLRYL